MKRLISSLLIIAMIISATVLLTSCTDPIDDSAAISTEGKADITPQDDNNNIVNGTNNNVNNNDEKSTSNNENTRPESSKVETAATNGDKYDNSKDNEITPLD